MMKCHLCNTKLKYQGKTVTGSYKYRCESCHTVSIDGEALWTPKTNFLRFKSKPLIRQTLAIGKIKPIIIGLFLISLALAAIAAYISPFYHKVDVQTFYGWADRLAQCGREIYLPCHDGGLISAYPSIGMLVSVGAMYIIKFVMNLTDWQNGHNAFRAYLFLFDLFNLFLLVTMARLMQFRQPLLMGLILFLIPSNLAGGAVWGQIDNISLTFCLITSIALIKSWSISETHHPKHQWQAIAWLSIAAISLPLFILTKQLSIFSIPYFAVIFIVTIIKFWQNWRIYRLLALGVVLGVFTLAFYGFDHIFAISNEFFGSSYYYVWNGGDLDSRYIISANGFNIWIFLGREPSSSSRTPFSLLWNQDFVLSPYVLGIASYVIWSLFLLGTVLILGKRLLRLSYVNPAHDPKLMAVLFLYHGLSQLGFNVLLSGTHERYLYLGYPFLLLAGAWFFSQRLVFLWRLIGLCFLSAFIYGCFVFSILGPLPGLFFPFSRHEFLASLHLFLLVVLADGWLQIYRKF